MTNEQLPWAEIREIIDNYFPPIIDKPLASSYLRWAKTRGAARKALKSLETHHRSIFERRVTPHDYVR